MRLLKLLIAFVVCLSLSIAVCAHPGRTDSKGGHTNHSTGEYHYHHGYSAHQHYDQDGDGTLDCPYAFTDKTESSSNLPKKIRYQKTTSSEKKTKLSAFEEFLLILGCIIGFLAVPIVASWILLMVMRVFKRIFKH